MNQIFIHSAPSARTTKFAISNIAATAKLESKFNSFGTECCNHQVCKKLTIFILALACKKTKKSK